MRINKYIASCGLCSRRKADELIKNGNVKVNGITVKEFGLDILEKDVVEVNGTPIIPTQENIYIALHKPVGFVTTMKDEFDRPTVASLVSEIPARLFPVGRLDYDTSGLLIMTNDGDMAYKLSHPKHKVKKTYIARINGYIPERKINILQSGVRLDEGFITSPAEVRIMKQGKGYTSIEISIYEGKNRQIRKMFEAVGHKVVALHRISIGSLLLGHLSQGHYRKLSPSDIEKLI